VRCVSAQRFNLQAAVRCQDHDPQAVGQLGRYITRPALVSERV
jgi:hypothetical protein